MNLGYARVSTKSQSWDLQVDALKKAGCRKVFCEVASGTKTIRPEWDNLMHDVEPGDTIVIWKLDRMGRSLKHLTQVMNELASKGVGVVSLNESIDTNTAQGRLMLNMFASFAEFEKDLIRERTMAGLTAARARGRLGGRPKGISEVAKKIACVAEVLYNQRELTIAEICTQLGIARETLYKYLRYRNVEIISNKLQRSGL